MDMKVLRDARDEAINGRTGLLQEIEALNIKEQHLSAAIASLELAIGDSPETKQPVTTLPDAVRLDQMHQLPTPEERTNWEVGADLLDETKRGMTVPEMMSILTPRGHKMHGDALRVAMIRRPDIFSKLGQGRYGLVAWPANEQSAALNKQSTSVDCESLASRMENSFMPDHPYRSSILAMEGNHI